METLLLAFTTFFVVVAPLKTAPIFAAMTQELSRSEQKRIAWRAVTIATIILIGLSILGEWLLNVLVIGVPSLRISGGILLFLMSVEIVQGKIVDRDPSSSHDKNSAIQDIAVFPLAIPLVAG